MKHTLQLTRIVTLAIVVSSTALGITFEPPLEFSEASDSFILNLVHSTRTEVESIAQIPPEEQTFDNTLGAWNRLTDDLSRVIDHIQDPPLLEQIYSVLNTEIFDHFFLKDVLNTSAQKISNDLSFNPFQRNAAESFLKNSYHLLSNTPSYVYCKVGADETEPTKENPSTLYFNAEDENFENTNGLQQKLMEANADVLCIQEINHMDTTFQLYESLKDQYAHFYGIVDCRGFSSDCLIPHKGTLIASKYPLDTLRLASFFIKETNAVEKNQLEIRECPSFVAINFGTLENSYEDLIIECEGNTVKGSTKHKTDDEGNSSTQSKIELKRKKNDLSVGGSASHTKKGKNGKSKNEYEVGFEVEFEF